MTMRVRGSLWVTGVLTAMLVLFGSPAAFAQGDQDPTPVTGVDVDGTDYDEVTVEWVWDQSAANNIEEVDGDDVVTARGFFVRWMEGTGTTIIDADVIDSMTVPVNPDPPADDSYRIEIDGLMPDTSYVVGVTALGKGDRDDAAELAAEGKTQMADEPDDVRNLELVPGDGMIAAMWDVATANDSPITAYEVEIKKSGSDDDDYEVVRTTDQGGTSTNWDISNLTNGTEYTVRVRAYSYTVPGDWSDEKEATPTMDGDGNGDGNGDGETDPDPATPTDKPAVELTPGSYGNVVVSWTAVEGATKYMVEWRTAAQTYGFEDRQMVVMGSRSAEIDGLKNGTEYMFRVLAGNEAGYGPPSDEAKATPMGLPYISEPTKLEVEAGDMMITASWGKPKTGADLVTGYRVSTRSQGGSWDDQDVGMAYEAVIVEGLQNGVAYDVRVCPYADLDYDEYNWDCALESAVTPMAVPALPIFGAVALGAGLLAAGRARLRRRELRAGRVQRQINR